MSVADFIIELKISLRSYDKRNLIDDVSIYRWVEIALKKFGGDIAMMKDSVINIKRGTGIMPTDFFDLIEAFKCDFVGYDVPEGDKVVAELQNTFAWKERTERSTKWNQCNMCCKEECEKTIVEKFYINVKDSSHEVRCYYNKPELLRLSKPMLKDACLSKCRNRMVKDNPNEINITNGYIHANFDGDVYLRYRAVPFDGQGMIEIPDTPQGLLVDYIENFVKMRLFEEWMYNNEVQGAADIFKLYAQQDLIKFRNAVTEVKMMNFRLSDYYKILNRNRSRNRVFETMTPMVDNVIKLI